MDFPAILFQDSEPHGNASKASNASGAPGELTTNQLGIKLRRWADTSGEQVTLLSPDGAPEVGVPKVFGEGAFGAAFLARLGEQKVVLKVAKVPHNGVRLGQECTRIKGIIRAMDAGAPYPGVGRPPAERLARCLKDFSHADPPFIALEFAGKEPATQSPAVVHGYFKQAALALDALAQAAPSQIHHDLKWENTAVEGGCLKLIDLDTVTPGTVHVWRTKTNPDKDVIPYTETYSPPEFAASYHRGDFRNFACAATAQEVPEGNTTSCPLAHSFDVYSLGVMTVQAMCGLYEFAIGAVLGKGLAREEMASKYQETLKALIAKGLRDFVSSTWMQAEEPSLREIIRAKVRYCKSLPSGSLELLERMLSEEPERRPRPRELLEAPLLQSRCTGCSKDEDPACPRASESRAVMVAAPLLAKILPLVVLGAFGLLRPW